MNPSQQSCGLSSRPSVLVDHRQITLLEEAEAMARARGCRHARLDTFDFQARDFYERLGYRVYAELPELPEGHRQFHLIKDLAAGR